MAARVKAYVATALGQERNEVRVSVPRVFEVARSGNPGVVLCIDHERGLGDGMEKVAGRVGRVVVRGIVVVVAGCHEAFVELEDRARALNGVALLGRKLGLVAQAFLFQGREDVILVEAVAQRAATASMPPRDRSAPRRLRPTRWERLRRIRRGT